MIFNEDIRNMCKQITELSTHNGVLNIEEQDKRLAMLAVDKLLITINHVPRPEAPPAIQNYRKLSRDQKFVFEKSNPDWRRTPTVTKWLDEDSNAMAENRSNIHWLRTWKTLVDKDRKEKIDTKLLEFNKNSAQIEQVRTMFRGKVVHNE